MILTLSRAALLFVLASPVARAETPHVSLVFASGTLDASSADIQGIERIDDTSEGTILHIRLARHLDARMMDLTSAHIDQTAELLICGELVVAPMIRTPMPRAEFIVTGPDPAHIARLQALLASPDCVPARSD